MINFLFQRDAGCLHFRILHSFSKRECYVIYYILERNVCAGNLLYNSELRNTRQNITTILKALSARRDRYKNGRESARKSAAGNIRQHYPIMYVSSRTHYWLSGVHIC